MSSFQVGLELPVNWFVVCPQRWRNSSGGEAAGCLPTCHQWWEEPQGTVGLLTKPLLGANQSYSEPSSFRWISTANWRQLCFSFSFPRLPAATFDLSSATMCCTSNPVASIRGSLMSAATRWSQTSVTPRRSTLATSCPPIVSPSHQSSMSIDNQSAPFNASFSEGLMHFIVFFCFQNIPHPKEWIMISCAVPSTVWPPAAVIVSSSNHWNLCFTQRRKPRGRRTVCLRSGSLPQWTNLSWWRWPSGTDRTAPGPSGTRSRRWTKPSLKLARKYDWRPEETVLSSVSLYLWVQRIYCLWCFHSKCEAVDADSLWTLRENEPLSCQNTA